MSALETWRTPLPDSEILSLRWAELLQPGLGRAGNLSVLMETRFSQPGEGLRKYGQCPVAPVSPADAGYWWWSDLPASSLGRWGLPPQPVVLAPPPPPPLEKLTVVWYNPGSMETTQTQLIPTSFAFSKSGFMGLSGNHS